MINDYIVKDIGGLNKNTQNFKHVFRITGKLQTKIVKLAR
jgi:hypothetical protein